MNSSDPKRPRATRAWFGSGLLHVKLEDGRVLSAAYKRFTRLARATPAQRNHCELVGKGVGIHWPDIDEDLSVDGLLRDAVRVRPAKKKAG